MTDPARVEPGEPVRFAPAVAHRHLDIDEFADVYVAGDVHGCLVEFEALLERVDPGGDDLLVFVGDLIRKGPDSAGVVERVREAPNMYSVRGNNEAKLLADEATVPALSEADREWIRSCPDAITWQETLVVHGGVDPRTPIHEQSPEELRTVRSLTPDGGYTQPYWWDRYEGPPRVFFGHTVLASPLVRPDAVGLDTGCVYGGSLTAYDWSHDTVSSVNAERTVEPRPESAVVDHAGNRAE